MDVSNPDQPTERAPLRVSRNRRSLRGRGRGARLSAGRALAPEHPADDASRLAELRAPHTPETPDDNARAREPRVCRRAEIVTRGPVTIKSRTVRARRSRPADRRTAGLSPFY